MKKFKFGHDYFEDESIQIDNEPVEPKKLHNHRLRKYEVQNSKDLFRLDKYLEEDDSRIDFNQWY